MRARFLILIGVNIILVIGVLFFTRNWLSGGEPAPQQVVQEAPPPKAQSLEVLTTNVDMPPGTLIKPNHLRWQPWPEENVSDQYLVREMDDDNDEEFDAQTKAGEAELEGAVIRLGLAEGQPFVPGSYVKPGERGFLAAIVSPGKRAVSIPISAASGGAGLILPGDRVDVILTQKIVIEDADGETEKRVASETIVNDIRILAFDQKVSGDPEDPEVARTATLEVSPRQAEVINVSQDLGKLALSLRSLETVGKDRRRGATWDYAASTALRAPGQNTQVAAPVVVRGGSKTNAKSK